MTTYPCGCVNARDPVSGAMRSAMKCHTHWSKARDPATLDESYYATFGVVAGGSPCPTAHATELDTVLGPLPLAPHGGVCLEIGGGVSPYLETLLAAGWSYEGVDPSRWAADWMRTRYGVTVSDCPFERFASSCRYGLILSAHSLEHMADAPGAVAKMADLLTPGGELWVVVPDDSDPVNPDHLWFFTSASLASCAEAAGLRVVTLASQRIVAHERFLYLRAVRP